MRAMFYCSTVIYFMPPEKFNQRYQIFTVFTYRSDDNPAVPAAVSAARAEILLAD